MLINAIISAQKKIIILFLMRYPAVWEKNMQILSSVVDPDAASIADLSFGNGGVLVIGNEGNGVSKEVLELSTGTVTIPMKGKAESLNASAAATILIWEFMKNK